MLSVLRDRTCDHLHAENERLRAENERIKKRLNGVVKFVLARGRASISVVGPGGAPIYATATLSQRECLETEGDNVFYDVNVRLEEAGGAACTLGSLLGSRLVLRSARGGNHPNVIREVADLTQMGFAEVLDEHGEELTVTFEGGDEHVLSGLLLGVPVSQLSDDVSLQEDFDSTEWIDGPPEWLTANRDVPVAWMYVVVSMPHLFRMYDSGDEGEDGNGDGDGTD